MRKCIIGKTRNVAVALELYLHDVSPRGLIDILVLSLACSCEIMHVFLTLPVPYAE
jgi:hypothetical protein